MKHYTNSDYALNKHSLGIVYKFADGIVEITLEDYLASNPAKTEADFEKLKVFSDNDYYSGDRATYRQTWKDILYPEVDEVLKETDISAEETFFDGLDLLREDCERQIKMDFAHQILNQLTEVQRRRYIMHKIQGLTTRQIAEIEGSKQQSIMESLQAAEKKIKKVLSKG